MKERSKDTSVNTTGLPVNSKLSFNDSETDMEDGIKVNTAKVQLKFTKMANQTIDDGSVLANNQNSHHRNGNKEDLLLCKICGKHVYHMERLKAEKSIFHKNCFRCKICIKQLNVDTYSSHEGEVYCNLHFKQLFQPKARFGEDKAPVRPRRNEMIIRENIPKELPPDIVRSNSKLDDGLYSLQYDLTNIRQRFESTSDEPFATSTVADKCALQRSESVMIRLQKYQSVISGERRMSEQSDVVSSPDLSEDEDDLTGAGGVVRETRRREKVPFYGLSSLKSQWESGSAGVDDDQPKDESNKKEELYRLRQRICLGRSASMRQVYEKACRDKSAVVISATSSDIVSMNGQSKAVTIKDKFERGQVDNDPEAFYEKLQREKEEDLSVVREAETAAREAKNIFKQMDANVAKSPVSSTPINLVNGSTKKVALVKSNEPSGDVIKCSDPVAKDDINVETLQVQEKFKFFECFKETSKEPKRFQMTPPREVRGDSPVDDVERDPDIIKNTLVVDDIPKTDTAKKMLDKFKRMENQSVDEYAEVSSGPKPLKRITPPRDYTQNSEDERDERDSSPERDPTIIRSTYKSQEDVIVGPEKARSLKAKFENWASEIERENRRNSGFEGEDDYVPQLDMTKNLRAKFEAIKNEENVVRETPKPRINRFVNELGGVPQSDICSACDTRLYPMEKLEFSGMKLHKNCFKCSHCSSSLRLDNYTVAGEKLYCVPHFKQLFMSKGNYDEGFGREQHKDKWTGKTRSRSSSADDLDDHDGIADEEMPA